MRNLLRQFCVRRSSRLQLQDFTRTDVSTVPPNRSPTHQSIVETLQNSKGISLRTFQASGCKQTCRVLTYFLSHQKVAIGLKNLMNRVNFSLHLTHPLRNTALCAYPLGSQRHLKSSVKKWIRMNQVLSGVPGTFPCADDVKVQWSTEERHNIHLLETVERACKAGLKFNPNKCYIKKQEIEHFGRIITPQGVKPCHKP